MDSAGHRRLATVLFALSAIVLLPILIVGIYTIDEEVHASTAYGFTIGQGKRDAFLIAASQFQEGEIAGVLETENYTSVEPNENNYRLLSDSDIWYLQIGDRESLLNNVRLKFEGDELNEIRRSRQAFELP